MPASAVKVDAGREAVPERTVEGIRSRPASPPSYFTNLLSCGPGKGNDLFTRGSLLAQLSLDCLKT